ncbi:MAG TPA: Tellurite resistance protein TerB [Cyanobacteria bacterium UBA11369]|nr:Tellurite resistance protein TerB [Cyanobacteria bacterium UBA11371]HBE32055.1 Tellurite resistance protein TerB [Cyanobacteria bacterium UBA11368]HBE49239.1 Tellurite resistance protein TerB [Cyanobacteria bacterium UBA11369]
MGNSDEVLESEIVLSPEEAVAAIVFAATFADGEITDEEIEVFNDVLSNLELYENYSDEELQAMVDKFSDIYDTDGIEVLFNLAVESISEDWVETAFEAAVEVVLVDGSIPEAEEDFISNLQQALGIDNKVAQEIIADLTVV